MQRPVPRRSKHCNRPLDPEPDKLAVPVAAIEHEVREPGRLYERVGAMTLDQEVGGAIRVQV